MLNDTFVVQPTDRYRLSSTIPDTGFVSVQVSTNLASKVWTDPGLTNIVSTTVGKMALLPGMATNFPAASAGVLPGLTNRTAGDRTRLLQYEQQQGRGGVTSQ